MAYVIKPTNIHIDNSYLWSKKDCKKTLLELRELYPDNLVLLCRSDKSLLNEWYVHTFLYSIGLWRKHTQDVDLNYPQKWYEKIIYTVFGLFAGLFIE